MQDIPCRDGYFIFHSPTLFLAVISGEEIEHFTNAGSAGNLPRMSAVESGKSELVSLSIALPWAQSGGVHPLIDRAAHVRTEEAELEKLWNRGEILHFCAGRFAVQGSDKRALRFLDAQMVEMLEASGAFFHGERYFLGVSGDTPYFLWYTEPTDTSLFENFTKADKEAGDDADESTYRNFATLRDLGDHLSSLELELTFHGQALANWHQAHPFCATCGARTSPAMGGSIRRCSADGKEHYPRTDPAVIVLVKDTDDRILLGHQKVWPKNRYSCFAGFVEPGEPFERAVLREVLEESGVEVTDITYLGSQPWPFPASIMIAYEALALNPHTAQADGAEIESIRWFSREEMRQAVHEGTLLLPPAMSVARAMINSWYGDRAAVDLAGPTAHR
jgi:NAD+ diphosphatase